MGYAIGTTFFILFMILFTYLVLSAAKRKQSDGYLTCLGGPLDGETRPNASKFRHEAPEPLFGVYNYHTYRRVSIAGVRVFLHFSIHSKQQAILLLLLGHTKH